MATENILFTELATRLAPVFMRNSANMDDLEIKDEREIIPSTRLSVEPGIYSPEFGVRSELNMLVRAGSAEVTGRIQTELVII
jgi:Xaa-Pro dipeptidase